MADAVTAELRDELGLEVDEDASGAETGSSAGNLLARIPAPEGVAHRSCCARTSTPCPQDAPIEVEEVEGVLRNRNEAILGADNKAAVAVILARRAPARGRAGAPVGIEILFTTCEELALRGAKEFDRRRAARPSSATCSTTPRRSAS